MTSHSDAIFERRLRPIYDNLEVGNNRKALQETERLLRKHPNMSCIRALKGLALMRLGRYEESNESLEAVANEKPVDEPTLQVLSYCYKELEQLDKIADLYNYAVKMQPNNEELLAHLFMSHVRLEDFKAQQATALQLYKAHPKNAYYFWAVMSVFLQGVRGPERSNVTKKQIYLSLAQRMIDKMIQDNRLESDQELFLYLEILRNQHKYQEALDFIEDSNNVYEKLCLKVPVDFRLQLYKDLRKWRESHNLLKDLLCEDANRWDYYQKYIDVCFEIWHEQEERKRKQRQAREATNNVDNDNEDKKDSSEKCPKVDEEVKPSGFQDERQYTVLDECHDFFCQLMELAERGVRGPYLARLELHKRMQMKGYNAVELLGDFESLITEYFHLFGDKACCIQDISMYMPQIRPEQRKNLAIRLQMETRVSVNYLPETKGHMQKHICAVAFSRMCGIHEEMSIEHLYVLYTTLKLHYEHGLMHFGMNRLSTDLGPSDSYMLIAANVLYDISRKEERSDRLFEALCLLQYSLRNSTSNFHIKLFCLKIYHMLGCVIGASQMFDHLDMKQIQMDSMGYVHCGLMALAGRFSMARVIYDITLKFFTGCFKDRLDYLALTYRFCSFSKVEEFMDFKERLTNSFHFTVTSVEAQICDLVLLYGSVQQNLNAYSMMNIDPAEDRISWHRLRDNRDLNVLMCWDPLHLVDPNYSEQKESFVQEMEVLRIRSLMLRLVAAIVDLYYPTLGSKAFKTATAAAMATKTTPSSATNETTQKDATQTTTTTIEENHKNEEEVILLSNNSASSSTLPEWITLEKILKEWLMLFERLTKINYKPLPNRFLVNLLPTRLHLLLRMPYKNFFHNLAQLMALLYWGDQQLPLKCKEVCDQVTDLVDLCSSVVNECTERAKELNGDTLWQRREWQGTISASIEMMSLYAFILSMAYEKLQACNKVKSRKKNENVVGEQERCQMIQELMRHLKKEFQRCDNILGKWEPPNMPRDLNSYMSDMSLKPGVDTKLISDVSSTFKDSHKQMINELGTLIKDKMRMVSK